MLPDERQHRDPVTQPTMLRHRRVPVRVFGLKIIVARPRDGAPVVLGPTAAVVWRLMDEWTSTEDLDHGLATTYSDEADEDRAATRVELVDLLEDDDLIERR